MKVTEQCLLSKPAIKLTHDLSPVRVFVKRFLQESGLCFGPEVGINQADSRFQRVIVDKTIAIKVRRR